LSSKKQLKKGTGETRVKKKQHSLKKRRRVASEGFGGNWGGVELLTKKLRKIKSSEDFGIGLTKSLSMVDRGKK